MYIYIVSGIRAVLVVTVGAFVKYKLVVALMVSHTATKEEKSVVSRLRHHHTLSG